MTHEVTSQPISIFFPCSLLILQSTKLLKVFFPQTYCEFFMSLKFVIAYWFKVYKCLSLKFRVSTLRFDQLESIM
jgi:hypothetical protein